MKNIRVAFLASCLLLSCGVGMTQTNAQVQQAQEGWKQEGFVWTASESCKGAKGLQSAQAISLTIPSLRAIPVEQGRAIAFASRAMLAEVLGSEGVSARSFCAKIKPALDELFASRKTLQAMSGESGRTTGVKRDALLQKIIGQLIKTQEAHTRFVQALLAATQSGG